MDEKKPIEDEMLDPSDFEDDESKEIVSDDDKNTDEDKEAEPKSEKSQEDLEKEEKAKNAHFAELRRKKEAEEKEKERKIREEATLQAKLGILKTNPFTDEPISDEEDLKIYEIQRQLDDEGKDPIADLPRRLAEINRKSAKEAAEKVRKETEEKAKIDEKINAEIAELREKYPKVDTSKLANDELYKECLKGKAGRWSQVEIYELYLSKKAEADKKAKDDKAKETVDTSGKKMTSVPSSGANGKVTPTDINSMSDEEFKKYWNEKYGA